MCEYVVGVIVCSASWWRVRECCVSVREVCVGGMRGSRRVIVYSESRWEVAWMV